MQLNLDLELSTTSCLLLSSLLAQSKNEGRLVCTAKRQNGERFRFPIPLPCVVANLFIVEGKGGSFQIKVMVGEQKQYSCVKSYVIA